MIFISKKTLLATLSSRETRLEDFFQLPPVAQLALITSNLVNPVFEKNREYIEKLAHIYAKSLPWATSDQKTPYEQTKAYVSSPID